MNELRNKFWKETSELIDAHRKNNDERAAQGVVDCRILFNRLVKKLTLTDVSQQRELLLAYEEFTSYKVLGKKTPRISKQMVEDYLANNCG